MPFGSVAVVGLQLVAGRDVAGLGRLRRGEEGHTSRKSSRAGFFSSSRTSGLSFVLMPASCTSMRLVADGADQGLGYAHRAGCAR